MSFDIDPFPNYCRERCNRLHLIVPHPSKFWSKAGPRTLTQVLFGILA
jgi:hypothetical protein